MVILEILFFFDTNCPHKAGTGLENKSRKIIRIDFEIMNWNKISLLSKINFIIKNLIFEF